MAKQPPWEIQVGRKNEILAEFSVPGHKLGTNDLKAFLRALVARYRTDDPEVMLLFYVNRRPGNPDRLPFAEVTYEHWLDQHRVGYWCGQWECYATAKQKIDATTADALKDLMQASKESR